MLEAYFEHYGDPAANGIDMIEQEWSRRITDKVTLCGKIDHVFGSAKGITLADIKTASEIGDWRKDLANQMARSTQLPLYDWELSRLIEPATKIVVEVITKPYRGSKAKVVLLDKVTEPIIAGRSRFDAQLRFKCAEMAHWLDSYKQMQPWPMADSWVCSGKYGPCGFMPLCLHGENKETLAMYQPRKEHLQIRKGAK